MPAARVSGITMAAAIQTDENETLKLADRSQPNVDNSATRIITLPPPPPTKNMKKPTSNLVRYRHCRNHLHCKSLDQLQKKACISLCTIHGAPEARRAFCRSTVVLTQTDDKRFTVRW